MPPYNDAASASIDGFANQISGPMRSTEADLQSAIQRLGPSPTTADLLVFQQKVQQWSMMTQLESTVVKEYADTLKGVIQKSG